MSKIELPTISSGYASISQLNDALQKIEDALNDAVLYRDNPEGEPNSMQDTLDMNSNRIINLPTPVADNEPVRLQDLNAFGFGNIEGVVPTYQPRQSGDGVTTDFSTPASAGQNYSPKSFFIYLDGFKQRPFTDYSYDVSTGNIQFVEAPANGSKIDIVFFQPNTIVNTPVDATDVLYSGGTNVQDELDALQTVGTLEQLKAIKSSSISDGTVRKTASHYGGWAPTTRGAIGGSEYYWDSTSTATERQGLVVKPDDVSGAGRWIVRHDGRIAVEVAGAYGDDSQNDTTAFEALRDYFDDIGGGEMLLTNGVYRLRNYDHNKEAVHLVGGGEQSIVRLFKVNDASDATAWATIWGSARNRIENIFFDNNYEIGNGILLQPTSQGMKRYLRRVVVRNFAGHYDLAVGGTYGVAKNFARADITDDNGVHKLVGGQGVGLDRSISGAKWELIVDGLEVSRCDGIGCDWGDITDSKFNNIIVGNCTYIGWILEGANCKGSGIKIYKCNTLNNRDDFDTAINKIVPHQSTLGKDIGGAIFAGRDHQFKGVEVQECGSNGLQIGFRGGRGLFNSQIQALVDGNGGIDPGNEVSSAADYRRIGCFAYGYWNCQLEIMGDDFRAKDGWPRQLRAFGIISPVNRRKQSSGNLYAGDFFRVTDNSGGADFTTAQIGYASPSNAVGTVFSARRVYPGASTVTWGTGELEVPNGKLSLRLNHVNQYEEDQGTGLGYDVAGDSGQSDIVVNGKVIAESIVAQPQSTSEYAYQVKLADESQPRWGVQGAKMGFSDGVVSPLNQALDYIGTGKVGTPSTISVQVGNMNWDGGHIVSNANEHIWIDSTGDLRIKVGTPTSDTDGTVVGTQT